MERGYKTPGGVFTTGLAFCLSCVAIVSTFFVDMVAACGVLGVYAVGMVYFRRVCEKASGGQCSRRRVCRPECGGGGIALTFEMSFVSERHFVFVSKRREDAPVEALTYEQFTALNDRYEAGEATEADLAALEPYRAKRAVLLASGFGSRMMPITINTPKPLVNVNGTRIIESLLDALLAIERHWRRLHRDPGYMSECFEVLKRRYPTITLLYNPDYAVTNNISSACVAKEHFQNAYAFESDLYTEKPGAFEEIPLSFVLHGRAGGRNARLVL